MAVVSRMRWIGALAGLAIIAFARPTHALFEFDPGGEFRGLVGEEYLLVVDPIQTVIYMINWVIGITGLIMVLLIVFAGYQWMTAMGSEDRVTSAKQTIRWAIIGMGLLMFSTVITWLVLQAILDTALLP